jgi:hypothetical protein
MRAVAELGLELSIGERLIWRPDGISGLDRNQAPVGPLNRDAGRPSRSVTRAIPAIRSDSARTEATPSPSTSAIPTLPCTRRWRSARVGLCFHHLGGATLCRPAAKLVAVCGGVGLDRHRFRCHRAARFRASVVPLARHRPPHAVADREGKACCLAPRHGKPSPARGGAPRRRTHSAGTALATRNGH